MASREARGRAPQPAPGPLPAESLLERAWPHSRASEGLKGTLRTQTSLPLSSTPQPGGAATAGLGTGGPKPGCLNGPRSQPGVGLAGRWAARGESKPGPGWPCKRGSRGPGGLSGGSRAERARHPVLRGRADASLMFPCIRRHSQRELDTRSVPGDAGRRQPRVVTDTAPPNPAQPLLGSPGPSGLGLSLPPLADLPGPWLLTTTSCFHPLPGSKSYSPHPKPHQRHHSPTSSPSPPTQNPEGGKVLSLFFVNSPLITPAIPQSVCTVIVEFDAND